MTLLQARPRARAPGRVHAVPEGLAGTAARSRRISVINDSTSTLCPSRAVWPRAASPPLRDKESGPGPWPLHKATARRDQETRCIHVGTLHPGTDVAIEFSLRDQGWTEGPGQQDPARGLLVDGPGTGRVSRGEAGGCQGLPSRVHRSQGCDSAPRPTPRGLGPGYWATDHMSQRSLGPEGWSRWVPGPPRASLPQL